MAVTKINAEKQLKSGSIVNDLIADSSIALGKINAAVATESYVATQISNAQLGDKWQESVKDILSTPPGTPSNGDRYLVGAAATDAWVGKENYIAEWDSVGGAWIFTTPTVGMFVSVDDDPNGIYYFGGAAWSLKAFEVNTAGGGITITDGVVAVNRLIEKFTATAGQVDFVLANSPIADGEDVFVNGVLQDKGATEDYTIATNTVTFNIGLVVGDKVIVKYLK
jgi:hypothetical protein